MINKEKYIEFCRQEELMPIFLKDWWLDAVCKGNWDVILYEENGKTIASMTYYINKKYCFKTIIPPHITPINGLWIHYGKNIKPNKRYSYEEKIMEYFAKEIDKLGVDFFLQKLHHSITNWLGFYWNGFNQTTAYTYRLTNLDNIDEVFSNFSSEVQKRIRKLSQNFTIAILNDAKEFYHINELTYIGQGLKCPFSFELFQAIEKACNERKCSKMFAIKDMEGNIHSVNYILFDKEVCYSLFSGTNYKYKSQNSPTILLWHILKYVSEKGYKEYDFTGTMIRPIETFIRSFGFIQTPYFQLKKSYSKIYSLQRYLRRKK